MTDATSTDLRYPTGPFTKPARISAAERHALAERIRLLPEILRESVHGLDAAQLDTPYRDGGWTVRQVVHHLGDSHMNALMRFKLGLTEDRPTIRPYDEDPWVRTTDATDTTLHEMLQFVESLHVRLAAITAALTDQTGARVIVHPDAGELTLDQLLAMYAWHGDHHVGQIAALRTRRGW